MPGNDREVFEQLTNGGEDPGVEDYLTYALFAFERHMWVTHRIQQNGGMPSDAEMQQWVSDITPFQFQQMRHRASQFFDVAARSYLRVEFEQHEKDVLQDAIVVEIRRAGSFRRQLGLAMLTALIGPVILGLVVVGALNVEKYLPTILGTKSAVENTKPAEQTKPSLGN